MNMFHDLQLNIEQERQAIAAAAAAQRRVDGAMPQAEAAPVVQPQPPAEQPAVEFDGDDRMCAICQEQFVHGDRVVRLRCRHILHRQCNIQLLENTDTDIVLCPACRGRADTVAEFRFIGADRPSPWEGYTAADDARDRAAAGLSPQDDGAHIPIHTPRPAAAAAPASPTTPVQPVLLHTPPSAASFQSALEIAPSPDSYQTWHDLHMPPPWPMPPAHF